jgi:PAS domain S-box-containing protein
MRELFKPDSHPTHHREVPLSQKLAFTRLIAEQTAEAFFMLDAQGRLIYMNPAAEIVLGWKQEELLGKILHDQVHYKRPDGSDFPMTKCHLGEVLTSAKTVQKTDDLWIRKDGSFVPVRVSCSPIIENGQVIGAALAMHDETELKRAQDELKRSQNHLRSVLDSIKDGFVALDAEWRFTFLNRLAVQAAREAGVCGAENNEQLVGKMFWDVFPKLCGTAHELNFRKSMRERIPTSYEVQNEATGVWSEVNSYPSEEGGITIYFRDTTTRKESELRFQRAIEIRDEVLSTVSHDLRNPLGAIVLNTSLILKRLDKSDSETSSYVRKAVTAIRGATQRMDNLIEDLLEITRIEAGRLELRLSNVSLAELFKEAVESVEALASQKSIHLETDHFCDLIVLKCDRNRIQQVFSNLLGNALKFTASGGVITLSCADAGEFMDIEVRDTGAGIPDEHLPFIFDRFWQAKKQRSGSTGLGLAIAKGIVQAHGGQISVRSKAGEGTSFRFTVPKASI